MNNCPTNTTKQTYAQAAALMLLMIAFALITPAPAAPERVSERPDQTRESAAAQRAQKEKEEATRAAKYIDGELIKILKLVNQSKTPDVQKISSDQTLLRKTKKFIKKFDKPAQCQYYMLSTWNAYFKDNHEKALKLSLQTYKTDPKNNDARITHAAMAFINAVKPRTIKPKPVKQPRNNTTTGRQRQTSRPDPITIQISSGNILNINADNFDNKILGKTYDSMNLNCLNSTSFSYDPEREDLCIILWAVNPSKIDKIDADTDTDADADTTSAAADPNTNPTTPLTPQSQRQQPRQQPDYPMTERQMMERQMMRPGMMGPGTEREMTRSGMMGPGMTSPGRPPQTITPQNDNTANQTEPADQLGHQMSGFANLFAKASINKNIKFVAINLDKKNAKQAIMKKLLKQPWPWAQVMANDPLSQASQFAGTTTSKAKLLIVRAGTVTYAGPAAGFLAPMVLNNSKAPAPKTRTTGKTAPTVPVTPKQTITARKINALPQNRLASEQLEDIDPQAEKLLEYAKAFLKIGNKLGSPKQGIEMCRRILKENPNTKYATQAQLLLRQLPERHKKRYKITPEETGL